MLANGRFGGGREDRLGQLAGIFQARRQRHAADRLRNLVFRPAASRQITAHHRLNHHGPQALDQHRAALHLRLLQLQHGAQRVFAGKVIRANMPQLAKPKKRHLREQDAFAGNGLAHDHIKSGKPVGSDHQDTVNAHGVVIADLPASEQRQTGEGGSVNRDAHGLKEKARCMNRSGLSIIAPP